MKLSLSGVSRVSAQVWASRDRWVSLPGVSITTKSAPITAGSSAASKRAFSSAESPEACTAACIGIGRSTPLRLA